MTENADPRTNPPNPAGNQLPAPPPCALIAMCVECGDGHELALPIDNRSLALSLAQRGWFISVMSPPGQGPDAPMALGPLCAACAQKVYPPELFAAAEQRRQQILQSASQPAAPAAPAGQGQR